MRKYYVSWRVGSSHGYMYYNSLREARRYVRRLIRAGREHPSDNAGYDISLAESEVEVEHRSLIGNWWVE